MNPYWTEEKRRQFQLASLIAVDHPALWAAFDALVDIADELASEWEPESGSDE